MFLRRFEMARKDRMPKREKRGKRRALKKPEMKYYLIVTDTEATERHYFEGLRRNLPPDAQEKLCIKVYNSNFAHQKRSIDLENTDFMPMKILPLCTFS